LKEKQKEKSKMVKRHLSMLNAPTSWPIVRKKGVKWIAKPHPGPHALNDSITLSLILRNILKSLKTKHEIKQVLNEGKLLINKKIRKDYKFPVGIMDVLEIPITKEHYRVLYTNQGMFMLHSISAEESKLKPSKIIGKSSLRGKKTQINLSDGRNMIVDKDDFKVSDTLIFDMTDWSIKKHLKFEKGATVYITEGKYRGMSGTVENIKTIFDKSTIEVKSKTASFETSKQFAFVIDESISLGESK